MRIRNLYLFFFFNDTATTEIYTLSLHDALPILNVASGSNTMRSASQPGAIRPLRARPASSAGRVAHQRARSPRSRPRSRARSEEHTSELQSQSNLVCRLLLEKKKNRQARDARDR